MTTVNPSDFLKETWNHSMISAGGIGLVTSAAIGRISPSAARRLAQVIFAAVTPCPKALNQRVSYFGEAMNKAVAKKDQIGAITTIAAVTIQGHMDGRESKLSAKERKDEIALLRESIQALQQQHKDSNQIHNAEIAELRAKIRQGSDAYSQLLVEKIQLEHENTALKEQKPETLFENVKRQLRF